MTINPTDLLNLIVSIISQAVSIALLVLIAATVAGLYGLRVPMVPKIDPTPLAWLCGAWWLYRGGKL